MKAQEYLDQNYPCGCSSEYHRENCPRKTYKLNLRNLNLEGDLYLKGFFGDLKVYVSGNPRLGKVEYDSSFTVLVYQTPQEFLNHQCSSKEKTEWIDLRIDFEQPSELILDNYPNLKAVYGWDVSNLTKITISNCLQVEKTDINHSKNLQELILHNLPNLKELTCYKNNLTGLDLTTCPNLQKIDCHDNQFTEIKFINSRVSHNLNQDLSFLKDLVNLEYLDLGNNKFYGSLEPLRKLVKLKHLNIEDTDIDSGLEYLPESVEYFCCLAWNRRNAKCKVLQKQLKGFGVRKNASGQDKKHCDCYNVQAWKQANPEKIERAKLEIVREQTNKQLGSETISSTSQTRPTFTEIEQQAHKVIEPINLNQGAEARPLGTETSREINLVEQLKKQNQVLKERLELAEKTIAEKEKKTKLFNKNFKKP